MGLPQPQQNLEPKSKTERLPQDEQNTTDGCVLGCAGRFCTITCVGRGSSQSAHTNAPAHPKAVHPTNPLFSTCMIAVSGKKF